MFDLLATDATHKLNYNNYPIILTGTVDMAKEFQPFGIVVTMNETADDYAFMFRCIKRLASSVHQIDYKPTKLLADAAGAITNGFKQVFDLKKRIFCWAHVKRAIDKEINAKVKGKIIQY
jgi:hypothetical protein